MPKGARTTLIRTAWNGKTNTAPSQQMAIGSARVAFIGNDANGSATGSPASDALDCPLIEQLYEVGGIMCLTACA